MNFEEGLEVADEAVFARFGRRLNDLEIAILKGSWSGQTYERIAEINQYSVGYLKRHVGPELWKILTEALGEEVSKLNFRSALQRRRRNITTHQQLILTEHSLEKQQNSPKLETSTSAKTVPPALTSTPRYDWGEVVAVPNFSGRTTEMVTLTQWVVAQRCRLVAVLGMGGIGKTALSVKLANQILISSKLRGQKEFDSLIWRSLRNASTLETLLADLVTFVSNQQETKAEIGRLIHYLRSCRCLLILDNMETIMEAGCAGQFRPGYKDYGEFLRAVGEAAHQSCIIITSREKPGEISALEGVEFGVRSLTVKGSPEAAQAILQLQGLQGSKLQRQALCDRYGNIPLALKIVANSIQDLFNGDIREFLEHDTVIFNGVRRLLNQQFQRLSTLEQSIMYWLAINREWTTVDQLCEDIIPAVSKTKILEALESLIWRSLIDNQFNSYTQQPIIMEYVTHQLTERIITELTTLEFSLFSSHALLKTTAKNSIRDIQAQLILQPIADQLRRTYPTNFALEQQLQRIHEALQNSECRFSGYFGNNLNNLCCQLLEA
ncbi:NB-ARC domain-containing protein [Nostoc sp. 106C]|uniref:NB-ARC domain-containing protein n=1 Tax=Nostoc sp. 106C TaxID=1932667 RepID=UPI000B72AE31|nr:NB-ARC domain-containing protein [Nostoc sp. 106C]OUL26824.1 hypothetical protein BV375_20430 [Nostoc sp. 106C]